MEAAEGATEWHVAELQDGFACRVRLSAPDRMETQFREPGGPWELPLSAERRVERSPRQRLLVLGASLVGSAAAAAAAFGPELGAGVMGLLLVHELGHVWAMRTLGLPCGPVVFIPLLGAAVEMRRVPSRAVDEGLVLLAGPLFGTCAAVACLDLFAAGGTPMVRSLGHLGLLVETCNLLPVGALDGGRLLPMLSPWSLAVGLAGASAMALADPQQLLVWPVIAAFVWASINGRQAAERPERPPGYYAGLSRAERGLLSAGYLSLLAILAHTQLAARATAATAASSSSAPSAGSSAAVAATTASC